MSFSVRYQALPERSRFFERLQEDRAFLPLLMALFPHGEGPFAFLGAEPEAATKILEEAAARLPGTFKPGAAARRRVAEFCAEAERTCAQFPGIDARVASLGESYFWVEGRLDEAVRKDPRRAWGWGQKLVYGDRRLTPGRLETSDDYLFDKHSLRVVSRRLVRKAAPLLRPLPPSRLLAKEGEEGRYREEYRPWRQFYLAAAEGADVLLVQRLYTADEPHSADEPPPPREPQRLTPPCRYCGAPLRTALARQCFTCGADWHDPENVVFRGRGGLTQARGSAARAAAAGPAGPRGR
jgi:hypothetical protein